MDFKNAKELLELCQKQNLPISEIMLRREMTEGEMPEEEARSRMARALAIMKESAHTPIQTPVRSMGGLIGGEAEKLASHQAAGRGICGDVLEKAITYAVAVLETNASMGLIVAAPTAGSAGVVPGMLLALQKCHSFSDNDLIKALFNAGAIGYLAMRNATVAGAVGGCQAEVGIASAMAASAAVELFGGSPKQCLDAAGVANALIAAEMALAGLSQLIPFDEMLETMYTVGKRLPAELRETAMGGCAIAPSACAACHMCS